MMTTRHSAEQYGDRHAGVYDRIYGALYAPGAAVAALAEAAGAGRVLELGVGTGRLAIPLAKLGVAVDGIEASPAMIAKLRSEPGGDLVGVFQVDLDGFELPQNAYTVAVCAASTLFMLPSTQAKTRCLVSAGRSLRPGGRLLVEAFRPNPSRFDAAGWRIEQRPTIDGSTHVVRSVHDPAAQTIRITHQFGADDAQETYEVTLTYVEETQLDTMATQAGLRLVDRWHDWRGTPATDASTDPISVYQR